MNVHRAGLLFALIALVAGLAAPAHAQSYPNRAVRIIVPYPPGGSVDAVARIVGQKMQEIWGQPVIIEDAAGAAGMSGTRQGAKAEPDGYTMTAIVSTTTTLLANVRSDVPYDPMKDFEPLVLFGTFPNILVVRPGLGVKTIPELIALLRASPGKYTYASTGYGATSHIAAEWFKLETKTDMLHVPFTGSAAALPSLLGGHVDMMFDVVATMWPQVESGKLIALGVGSTTRLPFAPDVPAIAETLPGFTSVTWFAMAAPPKTPANVVDKINAGVNEALRDPDVQKRFADLTAEPVGGTPQATAAYMREEIERWGNVIKAANVKLE